MWYRRYQFLLHFFIWLAHGVGTVAMVVASVAEWQEEHRPGKEIQWDFPGWWVKDCRDSVDDHLKTGLLYWRMYMPSVGNQW